MATEDKKREMTAEHLELLMAWAKKHWFGDCGCPELPCELEDTANGVALLIEQHRRTVADLTALREAATGLLLRLGSPYEVNLTLSGQQWVDALAGALRDDLATPQPCPRGRRECSGDMVDGRCDQCGQAADS